MAKGRGRPRREDMELPAYVCRAFQLHAQGESWTTIAEKCGTTTGNLRKWRQHPDAAGYIKQAIHSNIEESHGVITEALPMLAARLVELGLSSEVKPYAQIQAILGAFSVIDKGVTDRENAEQLAKVRETLERLEGGPPNVIDIT